MVAITDKDDIKAGVLDVLGKKLIEFSASWCGQCRALAPILEQIEKERGSDLLIYTCDAEENEQLAEHFGVRSLPTLVYMDGSTVLWKNVGMISKKDLEEKLGID